MSFTEGIEESDHADRMIAYWEARKIRGLAKVADYRPPDQTGRPQPTVGHNAAEQVAIALGIATATAAKKLTLARTLVHRHPETLTALESGTIDFARAKAVAEVTRPLTDMNANLVEQHILGTGRRASYTTFRQALRRQAIHVDPHTAEQRRQAAVAKRNVTIRATEDGTGQLIAYLSADEVTTTYDHITQLAELAHNANPFRTLAQHRADTFVNLVHGPDKQHVTVRLNLTMPMTTLQGLDRQPAELADYGPVTAEHAREIAWQAGLDEDFRRYQTGWEDGRTDPVLPSPREATPDDQTTPVPAGASVGQRRQRGTVQSSIGRQY